MGWGGDHEVIKRQGFQRNFVTNEFREIETKFRQEYVSQVSFRTLIQSRVFTYVFTPRYTQRRNFYLCTGKYEIFNALSLLPFFRLLIFILIFLFRVESMKAVSCVEKKTSPMRNACFPKQELVQERTKSKSRSKTKYIQTATPPPPFYQQEQFQVVSHNRASPSKVVVNSNDTKFNPPLFSLVNTFKVQIFTIEYCLTTKTHYSMDLSLQLIHNWNTNLV